MGWVKNNRPGRIRLPGMLLVTLAWLSGTVVAAWVAAAPQPPVKAKAAWVWDTTLISTNAGRNQMMQFAKSQQISRIFLQVNRDMAMSAYRSLIQTASGNNIEIYALDGAPDWALPEQRERITSLIGWVKSYNASVNSNERFAGIQVDVEPYLLPEWAEDQAAMAQHWYEAMSYFHDETKKAPALQTSAALPFWLDGVPLGSGSNMAEAMIGKLDEVALMSYRDQGEAAAELAQEELDLGDQYDKKVWVGLETNPVPDAPYTTFYEKGKAELERQMARIDELVKVHSSYAGIVVHDYTGWRSLKS